MQFKQITMRTYTVIFLVSFFVASVLAQQGPLPVETAPGPCPKPTTVKDFDPSKLVGVWYDIKRYKNTITRGSCGSATYTWYPSNNSYIMPYQSLEYPTNTLTLIAKDLPNGIFRTRLNGVAAPFDYWLLDTDYENYHVAYTCIEVVPLLINSQTINIYSRKTTLDDAHLSLVLANLRANKLDTSKLEDVEQSSSVCGRA